VSKINQYINKNYKKVIGWGTSAYYKNNASKLNVNLDYLIDSNENKYGTYIDGKIINKPETLTNENSEDTLIIIFSSFYNEICEEILKYGDFDSISGNGFLELGHSLGINSRKIFNEYEENNQIILTISRNNYYLNTNGLSKFMIEQNKILQEAKCVTLHIYWRKYNVKDYKGIYITIVRDGKEIGFLNVSNFLKNLKKVDGIIIHSLANLNLNTLDIILDEIGSSVPISYYLHDFSCICSNIKLMYNDDYFCNGYSNNWNLCSTCKSNESKKKIFAYHQELFDKKNIQLIAPSESTKEIILQSFNIKDCKIKVVPHQKFTVTKDKKSFVGSKIKIAYVGYKAKHKGWDIFKELVTDFKGQYEFYCFGFSDDIITNVTYVDVSFIDDGEVAMTKKLKENNIDVAFLWSLVPETYSYTYYESSAAGLYILTNRLSGNIYNQVLINNNGTVLHNYEELYNLLKDENQLRNCINTNEIVFNGLIKNNKGMSQIWEL